jgi:V8-like Glu-specific endopeptidase
MARGQAVVARATAAVFIDGRRAGSAVLVDPRHLVTAAHVLQRQDPGTLATVAVEQVELEFPGQGPGGQPGTTAATRVDLGPASTETDVAVLDLGEDRPGWLPVPVPVWPAARPPAAVQVFGYPLAEGALKGVWRQFTVAGPATPGTVQLDWIGDAHTFPGHSGGPVIDPAGHVLAGILVEGAERGRFDRFLPVTLIAREWPELPRPWLMAGAEPGEARGHFTRRAHGQRNVARGGDLFRGRALALDRVRGWLTSTDAPGQPLVVTGQPGAGKSAVLARAALSAEAMHGGPGLAFHARAATIDDFLTALADLTGIDTPTSADELVTSLADLPGQFPVPVVLDALDEAASDRDRRQITEALAELAVLPGLRIAVATRPLAVSSPFAPGGLLPALSVTGRDDHNLIDLDSDTYFDVVGLRQFAAALLAQDGMDRPGPPGAAWMQYRAQHEVRDRLAAVIAGRAGRNFLVAAMAAVPLSTARQMIDPAGEGLDPADIPSGSGRRCTSTWSRPCNGRNAIASCSRHSPTPAVPGWTTLPGSLSPRPSAMTPESPILMPCAVLRPLTTCSRPRSPSAPARSPACSTRPSPTSCSPRVTSPATKAPCSTCSSAEPSSSAGRTATCANTRLSMPPPPIGSISS